MRKNVLISLGFVSTLAAVMSGCGPGRTTAATQPTPAAFNAAASDAKAVTAVDAMVAKLGGSAAWEGVQQITWDQKYLREGAMNAYFRHSWDRWNGRHRFEEANMESLKKAEAEGKPDEAQWLVAMYDLLDHDGKGSAMFDGNLLPTKERNDIVGKAFIAFQADSYRLAVHYKLKDPGVILKHEGEVKNVLEKYCSPSCDSIKVTFDPAVGKDTFYVNINTETKMPEIVEKVVEGGRLGFALLDWVDVSGLRFPTKLQNLGMAEVFQIENIKVGKPDDSLYIPPTR
jgi:hypothetical protein